MSQVLNQFQQAPVKGQLASSPNFNVISAVVDQDESGTLEPGQCVKIVDRAVPAVTVEAQDDAEAVSYGVVLYNIKQAGFVAGDPVEIALGIGAIVYMEASAAIAKGAQVSYVVSGEKVKTAAGAEVVIGYALDKAAADGDLIRVYLIAVPVGGP